MSYIKIKNVNLNFPIYSENSLSLKNFILTKIKLKDDNRIKCVKALKDISIEIKENDRVGLLGLNGAGKSTFLRLLAGIYAPSEGKIDISGKVSTLFDLSLGMDDEASGYENIFIASAILGISKKKLLDKINEIISFTELGDDIYRPIKTYSAGMRVRLAFSIATTVLSDIILIDEIIGVGDRRFLDKASKRIRENIVSSKILLLASHAEFVLKDFCNKGIVFNKGKIEYFGEINEAIDFYNNKVLGVNE